MLWIALYLPQFPLQLLQRSAFAAGFGVTSASNAPGPAAASSAPTASPDLARPGTTQQPCVIADGPSLRPIVLCANTAARERGVKPGMPIAAARALAGELVVVPRDVKTEAQALHNLGCWASQFTPGVVLHPSGEGLLLDVSTVLTLHGGLSRLLIRLGQGIKDLGYHAEPGVAPTPIAAWILAKARHAALPSIRMCRDIALLPARLAPLPMSLLDWPTDDQNKLNSLGIRRIGDCVNLPRDGFIRRFGAQRRLELDRMLGTEPDPREWFTLPDTFTSHIDFGFEVNDALMLLFPLKRLLQELEGFLRGRGAGVQHWQLKLDHMSHQSSTLDLRVVAPERSAERFLSLAREKLAQATLQGSVLGIGLAATELLEFEEQSRTFIPDPRSRAIGWGQLIDKLTTRLGNDKVFRLRARDDHRPEQAFRRGDATGVNEARAPFVKTPSAAAPFAKTSSVSARAAKHATTTPKPAAATTANASPSAPRPLWLLRTPRALLSEDGAPLCQGRLRVIAGPERIESGWWDGQSARRDYYVARNGKGETFWIYREHRRSKDWYLHGIFG